MHGLVSILPRPFYEQVEALWQELDELYGIKGIQVTPYPHFSWQIAQDYDLDGLKQILVQHTNTSLPLSVTTSGLGLFTGAIPVIFISVVKTRAMIELHTRLWDAIQAVGTGISPYYSPAYWMPHISLAYGDVGPANIAGIMEKLAFRSFSWEMTIDNLALIYEPEGQVGNLYYQFPFVGATTS